MAEKLKSKQGVPMSHYLDVCERLCQCVDREDLAYMDMFELDPSAVGLAVSEAWQVGFDEKHARYRAARKATREALEAFRIFNRPEPVE